MSTKIIKGFTIEAQIIGKGSFAIVQQCSKDGKKYACKLIDCSKYTEELKNRILAEVEMGIDLTKKKVPNIVNIVDYTEEDNQIYVFMDLCKGKDLDYVLKKYGPLPESLIAEILFPIADCLQKLHAQKIIHRDLKLANILLTEEILVDNYVDPSKNYKIDPSIVRLSDFGFARYVEESHNNLADTFCGTPLYMAPEIYEGRIKKSQYTSSVDVWSFGVLIYRLLYNAYPFYMERAEAGADFSKFPVPKWRAISSQCLDLLVQLFRKNPKERIPSDKLIKHPFFQPPETKNFGDIIDGSFTEIEIKTEGKDVFPMLPEKTFIDLHNENVQGLNFK